MKKGSFCFKKREVIAYSHSFDDNGNYKLEIQLSNGNVVNLDVKYDDLKVEDLDDLFDFDPDFWSSMDFKNANSNNVDVKPNKSSTYNPYA